MKTALVTGASRGLGEQIAAQLRARGFNVIAPTRAEMDIGDERSIAQAAESIRARCAAIDVIVNNAGVLSESLEECLRVNAMGAFHVWRAFWPLLVAPGGRVVNVSSREGLPAHFGKRPYSVSKVALNALSQAAARNADGVMVAACCPGPFRSRLGGDKVPQSAEAAADTPVWLATEAAECNGHFYINRNIVPW